MIRLTAGVVLTRNDSDGSKFLVLRAYRNWDFPKGRVEESEEPLEAAMREVAEETGITELDFKWGHQYIETPPYSGNKVARFFIAETICKDVKISREHHEFRWLNYSDAHLLLHPRLKVVLDWAQKIIHENT